MTVHDKLKEFAEAAKWNGECAVLHRHYGDEGFGTCGDRKCGECRSGFFAGLAEEAGLDGYAAKFVYAHGGITAIEARMMPEGYEWPRYETGELLRCDDRYIQDGSESEVWHVDFDSYGEATILNRDGSKCSLNKGERVERPAPKVLDADGVEVKVGDTVYVMGFGEPLTVKGFADDGRVLMSFHDENSLGYKPSRLTHEQPDSWQRIEDDAKKNACEVFHPGEEECDGCRFEVEGNCEIGRVWNVGADSAAVCYHFGCTPASTPKGMLRPYDRDRDADLVPDARIGHYRFEPFCPNYDDEVCADCKQRAVKRF